MEEMIIMEMSPETFGKMVRLLKRVRCDVCINNADWRIEFKRFVDHIESQHKEFTE